jgi:type IV pilus biogenesis protein CpaD/CtpE
MAGCADIDPYRRAGMWQPEGLADGNMAAMVVTPTDLARGRGSDEGDGGRAAAAVIKWGKAGPGNDINLGGQDFSPGSAGNSGSTSGSGSGSGSTSGAAAGGS